LDFVFNGFCIYWILYLLDFVFTGFRIYWIWYFWTLYLLDLVFTGFGIYWILYLLDFVSTGICIYWILSLKIFSDLNVSEPWLHISQLLLNQRPHRLLGQPHCFRRASAGVGVFFPYWQRGKIT
jgi:hypothetical protein